MTGSTLNHPTAPNVQAASKRIPACIQSGSNKNECSSLSVLRVFRHAKHKVDSQEQRLNLSNKVEFLKRLSRGQSADQINTIEELKRSSLHENIKTMVKSNHAYKLRELYDLIGVLAVNTDIDDWFFKSVAYGVVIYTRCNHVFPGIRFQVINDHYYAKSFSYNIHF